MNSGIIWKWCLGVGLTSLPFLGSCLEANPSEKSTASTSIAQEAPGVPETNAVAVVEAAKDELSSTNDIAEAPAEFVSGERPLPPNIRPTSPVAELIKLADSGVNEGVMMAFVTNSTSTFNLGAEEIIYLKDLGVPDPVVTAMILRDQTLKSQPATALATATPWSAPPVENSTAPSPAEVAPQPDGSVAASTPELQPPAEAVSDTTFYDSLAPYGSWAYLDGYGLCWRPTVVAVSPGWQPYFNSGRWVWTDCGWYWLSDYSWGWAPFHYGRWFRHHQLGWCWAPDHVWGPSWVSWRYNDGYCGWAPLPPGAFFSVGVGLTFHGRQIRHWEDCGLKPNHYQFVAWNHFRDRNLHREHLSAEEHKRVFRDSVVATKFSGDHQRVINNGLPPEKVAVATRSPVRRTEIRESAGETRPIGRAEHFDSAGKTLTIYRPKLPNSTPGLVRWPSAESAPSAQRSLSQPSAPSAESAFAHTPLHHGHTPGLADNRSEEMKPGNASSRAGQNPSLILRGPQSSPAQESVPRSSLVIVGRQQNGRTGNAASSAAPASSPSQTGGKEPLAWNNSATPWMQGNGQRQPAAQGRSPSAAPGPAPTRPVTSGTWNNNSGGAYQRPAQAYRPVQSYQPPARTAPAEAPRSTPPPAQSAPRASSPPPASAPARPAPSTPAQSGRNQR